MRPALTYLYVVVWVLAELLAAVIRDSTSGSPAPTIVSSTIATEAAIVYMPKISVGNTLDRYNLNIKPNNLVAIVNMVSIATALNNDLITSPPRVYI